MTAYRPGPERIEPDLSPGGLVIRIYTPDNIVVAESRLDGDSFGPVVWAAAEADAVAAVASGGPVCLVVYDGDSGQRLGHYDDPRLGGDFTDTHPEWFDL